MRFDVGIAEGHSVTFSAGLAKEGMIPFCNVYSSFMQRAYDMVIHDVALQKLHMVICLDRAGLVGEDGATHHGVFDLAYLRPIPNLVIASPLNELDLRNLMYTGYAAFNGPFVIRYPRGKGEMKDWRNEMQVLPIGKGKKVAWTGMISPYFYRTDRKRGDQSHRDGERRGGIDSPLRYDLLETVG